MAEDCLTWTKNRFLLGMKTLQQRFTGQNLEMEMAMTVNIIGLHHPTFISFSMLLFPTGFPTVANIARRGDKWRAEVCIDRKRKAKSFPTKREAIAWANDLEQSGIRPSKTLSDAITRYRPIVEKHKGYQSELSRLNHLQKALGDYTLERLTSARLAEYRDKRLTEVAPVSVRRELIILSALFEVAANEWQWITTNPLKAVSKPSPAPARRRGITQEEIDVILANLSHMAAGHNI